MKAEAADSGATALRGPGKTEAVPGYSEACVSDLALNSKIYNELTEFGGLTCLLLGTSSVFSNKTKPVSPY